MINDPINNDSIKTYIQEHPKHLTGHYQELADKFGIKYDKARSIARRLRKKSIQEPVEVKQESKSTESSSFKENTATGEASLSFTTPVRIKTKEDLVALGMVDLEQFNIASYEITTWEGYRKNKSANLTWTNGIIDGVMVDKGGMYLETLYRVSVKLQRRKLDNDLQKQKDLILAEIKTHVVKVEKYTQEKSSDKFLLEISIFDHHFGKYAHESETGENYDLDIAEQRYKLGIREILERVDLNKIEKILFCTGGDLMHFDNINGTTTAGTMMDKDGKFHFVFSTVKKILIESIDFLSKIAPVDVVIVNGNHDCFDEETDILTEQGWVRGIDLKEGVEVATFNLDKNLIEYQTPQSYINKPYQGEMIYFSKGKKDSGVDLLVTSSHRLMKTALGTAAKYSDQHWGFETVMNTLKNTSFYFKHSVDNFNKDLEFDDNIFRLIGWIASDGSISVNKKDDFCIYQSKEENFPKIRSILDALGITYKEKTRERNITEIQNRPLLKKSKICHEFYFQYQKLYNNYKNKYVLPEILKNCSKRQFDIFLESFVDGDGSRYQRHGGPSSYMVLYGIKKMLEQIQILCVKNGIRSILRVYRSKDYKLNVLLNSQKERLSRKLNFQIVEYTGRVWCVTVPNTSLIIRRNGVVSIQGNCQTSFTLGEVLDAWYHNNNNVSINNSPKLRKYYEYGLNSILFTHGDKEPHKDLGLIFASEEPTIWSSSKFRFIQTGHFHKSKSMQLVSSDEFQGFKIQILPSLCGSDSWHYGKGYISMKQAKGFLYDKKKGLIAEFTVSV